MPIDLAPEVAAALARGGAVVALESTLICHGIPRPRNLDLAYAVERAVRDAGAVPATVAILDGRLRLGVDDAGLRRLATATDIIKASGRDLGRLLASGHPGATTVAGTIFAAARAGIRVMATGGLGGVHRGGERSLDVSADLHELARCPMVVVCSGIKAILDLPRTLEMLESLGVAVVGMGTDELPAFYARRSGLRVPAVADARAAAEVMRRQLELGWPGALVVANPPPADLALDSDELDALVGQALAAARGAGVRGPDETPFLLAHMAEASGGRTVALNEALVLENATLAARLALALAEESAHYAKIS